MPLLLQNAFKGHSSLTDNKMVQLNELLKQANAYSDYLLEQMADLDKQYNAPKNGKRKAAAEPANGTAKRCKGAAAEVGASH